MSYDEFLTEEQQRLIEEKELIREKQLWKDLSIRRLRQVEGANKTIADLIQENEELRRGSIEQGQQLQQAREWGQAIYQDLRKMNEREGSKVVESLRDKLRNTVAQRDQVMGLLSWHADEAVEAKQSAARIGEWLTSAEEEIDQLRREKSHVVVEAGYRGQAIVNPKNDVKATIAKLEQRIREQDAAIKRQAWDKNEAERALSTLTYQVNTLSREKAELQSKVNDARRKTQKAGELVGRIVGQHGFSLPRVNAAIRLAEAMVTFQDWNTGRGCINQSHYQISAELEAASNDYRHERDRHTKPCGVTNCRFSPERWVGEFLETGEVVPID